MHEYIYYKNNYYKNNNYTLGGSITHYYHFLLGFLIPFILDISTEDYSKKTYIFNDIFGPMTKIMLQLPLDIKIGFKSKIKYKTRYWKPLDVNIKERQEKLYTIFTFKNYITIQLLFNKLQKQYELTLPIIKYDVILIERKVDISYKTTEYKKKNNPFYEIYKTSGNERRSIVNFDELYLFCVSYYKKYKILKISLEHLPFFEQYNLFNNAKIVILQHGAAVGNVIFMKPNTTIIEFIPQTIFVKTDSNIFPPLSITCKVNHYQYLTNSNHATIDINKFKYYLNDIKENKIKTAQILTI